MRIALILHRITNIAIALAGKQGEGSVPLDDFIIDWDPDQEALKIKQMNEVAENLKRWAENHNRGIERKEEQKKLGKKEKMQPPPSFQKKK